MKNIKITFRVDTKLKEKIKLQSKKANMSMSKYITEMLLSKDIVVIEEGSKIYFELNKIGNNVNQISKKINSSIASNEDIKELSNISRSLKEIWRLLNLLMSK